MKLVTTADVNFMRPIFSARNCQVDSIWCWNATLASIVKHCSVICEML
jgi:hypothetical protein